MITHYASALLRIVRVAVAIAVLTRPKSETLLQVVDYPCKMINCHSSVMVLTSLMKKFRHRRLTYLVAVVIIVFLVHRRLSLSMNWTRAKLQQSRTHFDILRHWNVSSLPDKDQTCRLPKLHPFDAAILDYLNSPLTISCKWPQSELTFIQNSILQFNKTALDESGYSPSSLSCYYQSITRPAGQDDVIEYGTKQQMTGRDVIQHDFIYVHCVNRLHVTIYTNMYAHPRKLPHTPAPRRESHKKISVFAFGVDSLSHMNAIRYLPNTYRYLTQTMGAHIMHGMARIGDNTWPNAVAMITGKRVSSTPEEIKTLPLGEYYDNFPAIWKNFSKGSQYVTLLAEDVPKYTLFNQEASGFMQQPTDHYFRPFWVALESLNKHKLSSFLCFGESPKHTLQLQYLHNFVIKHHDVPYFAFSILTEIGHDNMALVGEADDDFAKLLHDLFAAGYLNDTTLFFFGDHGHRFDPIILTELGRIDSNLPFSAIVLPPSIRTKFPEVVQRLQVNTQRLTSMFDYYETFVDILHYVEGKTPLGQHRLEPSPSSTRRAYSLFGNIPLNRTCEEAGIPAVYCPCSIAQSELSVSDDRAKMAATVVVTELNAIISQHTNKCAMWSLSEIKSAYSRSINPGKSAAAIRLVIQTNPGNAIFEALVEFGANRETGHVVGKIKRVNRYKGQDTCLSTIHKASDLVLRRYCYCM